MMDKFTASNGLTVDGTTGRIIVRDRTVFPKYDLGKYTVEALREFFRAERDEELGRWRWPEKPEYVVYPSALYSHPANPDRVTVVNEQNGQSHRADRDDPDGLFGFFSEAGHAYFAAHPERKPWDEAEDGEVWALTTDAEERAFPWVRKNGEWVTVDHNAPFVHDAFRILDARRIWPEPS